jgi:hypothetical protein
MRNNHVVKVAGLGLLAMLSMNLINVASLRAQNDADFKGSRRISSW